MEITINGAQHKLPASLNILELLATLEIDERVVIVELNEKIVKRDAWLTTFIKDSDVLELVAVVGGG